MDWKHQSKDTVAQWINKTNPYAAYKRLISDLKTYLEWKYKDGKRYFMQIIGRKQEQQYLRQTK